MEKKSILNTFRRPNGNKPKDEIKDKKHRSDETREEVSERKTWPSEERIPDPIRRVTPIAKPRQRASNDDVRRARGLSDTLNLTLRSSPLGPRNLPRDNNGERAPYEPKYFPRSDWISSLNGSPPTKAANASIQGARSMSQASTREDNTMSSITNSGRNTTAAKSSEYPPRRDSVVPQLRRGQSNSEDKSILDLRLSQAYDIKQGVRHPPTVPEKNETRAPFHGDIAEATQTLEKYPNTPRKPRQRSKLNQETSIDSDSNASKLEQPGGISRWPTYSAQDSPKMPVTPGRSVSNGAEMQQWLQQNTQVLKKFGSPERPRLRDKYEHISPRLKNEAEAFERFKTASHRRKVSIEAIRKAQEAMIVYPQKKSRSRTKRSPSAHRKASARNGLFGEKDNSPVAQKRLPELRFPPEEMPSPFLRPEEKRQVPAQKPSIDRKPVHANDSAQQYPDNQQILQPSAYQYEDSPELVSKQLGRSRLPTPSRAIRRKTLKGPSISDLAAKRALEYQRLAGGNPFESRNAETTSRLGIPRSYPEQNIAIRAIATPTYEEIDSEPFEYPELVPKPLNIVGKRASKDSTIRTVLGRKPTLRTSKTQEPPSSTSNRGYWNYGNRTKSDDFEIWKERQNQDDSMKKMHDQIDDYLDLLLKDRIESKLAEEELDRQRERVANRTTAEKDYYFSDQSVFEDGQLHRASMDAEMIRWGGLSTVKAQSSSLSVTEQDAEARTEILQDVVSEEEAGHDKEEMIAAKVKNRWAEMRAKLRVDSTYSDLSMLARSANP